MANSLLLKPFYHLLLHTQQLSAITSPKTRGVTVPMVRIPQFHVPEYPGDKHITYFHQNSEGLGAGGSGSGFGRGLGAYVGLFWWIGAWIGGLSFGGFWRAGARGGL
ncbi:hypothetical protein HAX54_038512 [Datura stramonium]|uniref:Uncharacterized protein n=1 Tax=Datura stramonium TaxID=4076 RepID=A0ABS8VN64_DATST|nr:hypothetical protein [Datura stramonium]